MSEIKAIDKLREQAEREPLALTYILNDIADEIEAEIAANYMRLPCDADGVPIHVGDKMKYKMLNIDDESFTILGVNNDGDVFYCLEEERSLPTCISYAGCLCHVKSRTLEDVLNEFGIAAAREFNADPDGYGISDKTIANCVSEIRELLGGDA